MVPGVILPDEAYTLPFVPNKVLLLKLHQILAIHIQAACCRAVEPAQHIKQGGFTAAAVADNRHQLTSLHMEVKPLQREYFQLVCLVDFDQSFALYQRLILPQLYRLMNFETREHIAKNNEPD